MPVHSGDVGGNSAVDLTAEELQNLRPALLEPGSLRNHAAALVKEQRVGETGVGGGLGFVVVDRVHGLRIGTYAGAQGCDVKEIEEALVVLLGK